MMVRRKGVWEQGLGGGGQKEGDNGEYVYNSFNNKNKVKKWGQDYIEICWGSKVPLVPDIKMAFSITKCGTYSLTTANIHSTRFIVTPMLDVQI